MSGIRKLYMEMRYEQRSTMTELVCFDLDADAVAGLSDEQIVKRFGPQLTCAEADGGMSEPEEHDHGWCRTSLELADYGLSDGDHEFYGPPRVLKPSWVPSLVSRGEQEGQEE